MKIKTGLVSNLEAERLSVLTTRAMVNGLHSMTPAERKERDDLAIRLLYTKDSKGRLTVRQGQANAKTSK